MFGDLTLEQVPIQLPPGAGGNPVSFHPDGSIAGLFFLRAGAPLP